MWGEYDYKYRFLGKQRKLNNIAIYRTRWHMVYTWKLALHMRVHGAIRHAKLWKNDPERKKGPIEIKALQVLTWIAKLKTKASGALESKAMS